MADRFDDLQKYLDDKFADNKSDHEGLARRQDHTNGDVKSLKLWQARILGGFTVIVAITGLLGFILKDQIDFFLHPDNRVREAIESAMADVEIETEIK